MKQGQKFFHTSLFGYKKKDVNAYIISLNRQAETDIEEAKENGAAAIIEVDNLKERIDFLHNEIDSKEKKINQLSLELEGLKKELEAAENKTHTIFPSKKKETKKASKGISFNPVIRFKK